MSNAVAPTNNTPVQKLKEVVKLPSVQEQFKNALGENSGMFTASLIDVYATDQTLQKCEPKTVVMEALKAATLQLPINRNLGFAYIVPYKGKATMQIGYKGYIQLAMRTGQYRIIHSAPVYEGELKGHDKLTGTIDLSGQAASDKVIGYFAHIETVSGFKKTIYWTTAQIVDHAKKYSQSYNSQYSPWKTSFDAMAQKTVLKHLLSKYGVMSVELVRALNDDAEREATAEADQYANQGEVVDAEWFEQQPHDPETGEVQEEQRQEQPEPATAEAGADDEPGF